jgi:hypothetical protein
MQYMLCRLLSDIISRLTVKRLLVCSALQFCVSAMMLLLTQSVQLNAEPAYKIYKSVHSRGAAHD